MLTVIVLSVFIPALLGLIGYARRDEDACMVLVDGGWVIYVIVAAVIGIAIGGML